MVIRQRSSCASGYKAWLLTLAGSQIGDGIHIDHNVWIRNPKGFSAGRHVVLSCGAVITCGGFVTLEDEVMIGYGAKILSANHIINGLSSRASIRFSGHTGQKVKICSGAWVGANAIILPGVTIGEGAVVAAGAVVTKDVQDHYIVAGVPAKPVKKRS